MNEIINSVYFYLCFCYLLAVTFKGACGQSLDCPPDKWRCKNGQCIREDEACDGRINCSDGSDETTEFCLDVRCPGYSFQCAYGACIAGTSKCNGLKDCADNSDESPSLCGGEVSNNSNCSFPLSADPSDIQFQCDSGECIPEDEVCDGARNCQDASDESVKYCASRRCPAFSFRCGYGGCVSGKSKCDGKIDCVDGSDESLESCPNKTLIVQVPIYNKDDESPGAEQTTPPTRPITPPQVIKGGCQLEIAPSLLVYYEYDGTSKLHNGAIVENFHSVIYKCRERHILFGKTKNTCVDGSWTEPIPECARTCSSRILQGVTFDAKCTYGKQGVDCNSPVRPGTQAKITCSIGYHEPERSNIIDILKCESTGDWDYHPTSCEPECGRETVSALPFLSNADITNITSVPWHTAIYRRMPAQTFLVCGGSIISAKLVITAAHCFAEDKDPQSYAVVVGKVLRNYLASEKLPIQNLNVSEIHIPRTYQGPDGFYHNDIALLVLTKFIQFRHHIKPICLKWLPYSQADIPAGTEGKIAGWGRVDKDKDYSDVLRSIKLTVIRNDICIKKVSNVYDTYINSEKFCVGHEDDEEGAACQGDSGGGFVVPKSIRGVPTYFLQGVLSTSLSHETCGLDYYVTFTNILYHREMITEYLTKHRPK